jgi:hypothetical protein
MSLDDDEQDMIMNLKKIYEKVDEEVIYWFTMYELF